MNNISLDGVVGKYGHKTGVSTKGTKYLFFSIQGSYPSGKTTKSFFINAVAFGDLANTQLIPEQTIVSVSGYLSENVYKKKDGTEGRSFQIVCQNIKVVGKTEKIVSHLVEDDLPF